METIIITNNEKVNIDYSDRYKVEFYPEKSQLEILLAARDYVHLGGKLLMHPMMGRIKPHETPYKSVILETGSSQVSMESLLMIEDSIQTTRKFMEDTAYIKYYDEILSDLQFIDKTLLDSGVEELER
ncbi:hypothetical protein M2140_001154 [Clostridiales Family XIII bacterium PM5-7]